MEKEIVLKTFLNRYEAEMAKGLLDEKGIDSMVSDDDVGGLHPGIIVRECNLVVNEEDLEKAKDIIRISEIKVGDKP
jgi:hypothetical protein